MENALFYTFSTIAQTLGAAIASLGAFALYRLQTIGATLENLGVGVIQPCLHDDFATTLKPRLVLDVGDARRILGSQTQVEQVTAYEHKKTTFSAWRESSELSRNIVVLRVFTSVDHPQ